MWLSPDDTYLPKIELGAPMRGLVLGRVVESKASVWTIMPISIQRSVPVWSKNSSAV